MFQSITTFRMHKFEVQTNEHFYTHNIEKALILNKTENFTLDQNVRPLVLI